MNRRARRQEAKRARRSGRVGDGQVPRWLEAAHRHREAGSLAEAKRLYGKILDQAPARAEALHWLGVIAHAQGQQRRASELLERAVEAGPDDPLCLFHLAELRRELGRPEAALPCYRGALERAPGVGDIQFGLGTALLDLKRFGEAANHLAQAVRLAPDDPEAHNNLANALAETGSPEEAEAHYRAALRLRPDYAEARMNLGTLLSEAGRDRDAEACYRGAIASGPHYLDGYLQFARFLKRSERGEDEAAVLRDAAARFPASAEVQNALGRCLVALGLHDEALGHYRRAIEIAPDLAEAHFNLGVWLQAAGRFDEASEAHERAIALRPELSAAHYNLALIRRARSGDEDFRRLEALLDDPSSGDEARINAHFSLGKAHDAAGRVEEAFDHYRRGNEIKAASVHFDPARHEDFIDRTVAVCDQAFFAARRGWGVASDRPILIVGMPRSGTTLVEQILASHPAVHGAGELDDFRHLVDALPRRLGATGLFPECLGAMTSKQAEDLGREHLERLGRRAASAKRITDKMPGNYLRLGLVAPLLPGARIIHCRRDPLDTCLSCYVQNFAQGLSFSYDLGHLGLVYREYERLMAHWHAALPLPILDLDYEDLIADQETVSRGLVDFCGLPWDARCLAYHEQDRPVRTASFWQVRQPIYRSSIGRWRAYERHLAPLIEALGDDHAPAS